MSHLTTRNRLIATFWITFLLAGALTLTSALMMIELTHAQEKYEQEFVASQHLINDLRYAVRAADDDGAWYIMATNVSDRFSYQQRYTRDLQNVQRIVTKLHQQPLSPTQQQMLASFEQDWTIYLNGNNRAFAALATDQVQAQEIYLTIPYDPTISVLDDLDADVSTHLSQFENQTMARGMVTMVIVVILGVILITVILTTAYIAVKTINHISTQARAEAEQRLQQHMSQHDHPVTRDAHLDQIVGSLSLFSQIAAETTRQIITYLHQDDDEHYGHENGHGHTHEHAA